MDGLVDLGQHVADLDRILDQILLLLLQLVILNLPKLAETLQVVPPKLILQPLIDVLND